MLIRQAKCLQQTNTYFNRAVGFYLQKNGVPVIPNIRWSDESSLEYCFLGVPEGITVCVSTHGCIRSKQEREIFKLGMHAMLNALEPSSVLVHGKIPDDVFSEFHNIVKLHRYPSQFEMTHEHKGGAEFGNRL